MPRSKVGKLSRRDGTGLPALRQHMGCPLDRGDGSRDHSTAHDRGL